MITSSNVSLPDNVFSLDGKKTRGYLERGISDAKAK